MRYFGLIGYPLGHSFSQRYFSAYFKEEGIEAQYDLYPLENIDAFPDLINRVEIVLRLNAFFFEMSWMPQLRKSGL